MTHTIDTILSLADAYAQLHTDGYAEAQSDFHTPAREKLHAALVEALAPTIKQSLTVAEQSAELDAGMAAQHYCRGLWGAARGHSDWRKVHEHFVNGYKQGRYDELQAQGPIPWPDEKPACHHEWVNRDNNQPWLVCEKCGDLLGATKQPRPGTMGIEE